MIYPVCNFLQRITLWGFSDFNINGSENVPPYGPLIVVSNHMSDIDPSMLAVSIKRRLRFLAKSTLFTGFPKSQMLYLYGAYPLNRRKADIQAFRWAKQQLAYDGTIVLFPEGTRNGGSMIEAKQGVVRLIQMTDATILPVGITGTENLNSVMRIFNPTGKITVNIGTAFSLPKIEGKLNDYLIKSMNDMIMDRIADLIPEKYRGRYGSAKRSK